jgi:hypothetical protein
MHDAAAVRGDRSSLLPRAMRRAARVVHNQLNRAQTILNISPSVTSIGPYESVDSYDRYLLAVSDAAELAATGSSCM